MSAHGTNNLDRLHDLMADHALQGLTAAEKTELEQLRSLEPRIEIPDFEWTVASIAIEMEPVNLVPVPQPLREKIESDAVLWQAARRGIRLVPADRAVTGTHGNTPPGAWMSWISWMPWLVAAACLLLAASVWVMRTPRAFDPRSIVAAADVQSSWQSNDLGVSGEVVWDTQKQTGFMRFRNLPVNDPAVEQYQLWIFDANRDQARPVDGGVFNSTSENELIIPIDAKLGVNAATLFAVTIEPPGGVVVSDRERLVLLSGS